MVLGTAAAAAGAAGATYAAKKHHDNKKEEEAKEAIDSVEVQETQYPDGHKRVDQTVHASTTD